MNYAQLITRLSKNKLPTRKMGELNITEIPPEMPMDQVIEIIAFAQIAQKYEAAYRSGTPIPEDLTDEIFAMIEKNKK